MSDRQRAGRREKQAVMVAERRGDERLNKPEKMEVSYRSSFQGKGQQPEAAAADGDHRCTLKSRRKSFPPVPVGPCAQTSVTRAAFASPGS